MAQTIFRFKPGSRVKGNAEEIGQEFERIRSELGGLTADNVVAAAEPEDSILHRYFTWDDQSAAVAHRKAQAAHLIASVTVVVRHEDGTQTEPVRAFVSIGEKQDRYLPVLQVMADPQSRTILLHQAVLELAAFQQKYAALKELASVFAAIDAVTKAA